MSPELILAIKERVAAGQTKEEIKSAVLELGHAEPVFESAYTLALHDLGQMVAGSGSATTVQLAPLPSVFTLVSDSLAFVCKRLDLIAFTLVPALVVFGLTYGSEYFAESTELSLALLVASILATIIYVLSMVMVLYMVCKDESDYKGALMWTGKHIFPLIVISLLMAAVFFAGLFLLIIPGFIFLILLYFSQYAYILEDQKGIAALVRSRELLRGRFGAVAGKLIGYMFALFIPLFVIMILVAFLAEVQPVLKQFSLVGELAVEAVSAVFGVMSFYAMSHLYKAMQIGRPVVAPTKGQVGLYAALAIFGVVATSLFIAAIVYYGEDTLPAVVTGDVVTLKEEIQSATVSAELYAVERGSFAGVCDTLRGQVTAADVVECNDSEGEWVIAGNIGEERWCADADTSLKQINNPIGERLTCLNLPERQIPEAVFDVIDVPESDTASTSAIR